MTRLLPKLFQVAFTALAVLAGLISVCVAVIMLVDPELSRDRAQNHGLSSAASLIAGPAAKELPIATYCGRPCDGRPSR